MHVLAKQLQLSSKELLAKLKELNVSVKGHMSALDDETARIVQEELKPAARKIKPKAQKTKQVSPAAKPEVEAKQPAVVLPEHKVLKLNTPLSVKDLAVKLTVKPSDLIKRMMNMKIMATINQMLDEETVRRVLGEYGVTLERLPTLEEELLQIHKEQPARDKLCARAPVVTFMGHVDHGKTSLLDTIRQTKVAAREAGGITQHIGAYMVETDGKRITFLDTPGHEAFTAMRARGANATDIVVLVVAADDGVMPQTIEAIDHARAAGVPIIVAINKCDLPNINTHKVKAQLSQHDLTAEDIGGKIIMVNVSAKTGEGIDNLLEMILLEAEMLELKANPDCEARGVVIESRLSRGTGPTATVLVQNGTLAIGDMLICGNYCGRVKTMKNNRGEQQEKAGPSGAVEISGLSGVPEAGESFFVVNDEKKARDFSLRQIEEKRLKGVSPISHISLEQLYQQVKEGKIKELSVIIKADVQGSLEAILHSLEKLATRDVTIKIMHSGVGEVNVSDVILAAASNAIIVAFHVGIESGAKLAAEKEKVDIRLYEIIYEAIADIKSGMEGLLEPHIKEVFTGRAQVRQVFKVSKIGNVAGCIVLTGKITSGAHCRIVRNGEEVFKGKINSLKKFKEDAAEVITGMECGIGVANFKTIYPADIIECFEIQKVARRL